MGWGHGSLLEITFSWGSRRAPCSPTSAHQEKTSGCKSIGVLRDIAPHVHDVPPMSCAFP